jgi:hypothetical protein
MPPPTAVVELIQADQANRLMHVRKAARWLSEFADAWTENASCGQFVAEIGYIAPVSSPDALVAC